MKTFINLSNHPSARWSEGQLKAAQQYGEVVDISFPDIAPAYTEDDVKKAADEYVERIMRYDQPTVMVQGEFTFVYQVVETLKTLGVRVVSACSERIVEEKVEGGDVIKTSLFRFVRFREY